MGGSIGICKAPLRSQIVQPLDDPKLSQPRGGFEALFQVPDDVEVVRFAFFQYFAIPPLAFQNLRRQKDTTRLYIIAG